MSLGYIQLPPDRCINPPENEAFKEWLRTQQIKHFELLNRITAAQLQLTNTTHD
jgi:hypothetical protein